MPKRRSNYTGTETRRRQIIQAALECFNEMGLVDTTMGDIRTRSRASNGSIYHHFKSKDQLAAAVYLDGILDYQTGMIAALEEETDARKGIYGIIRYHLTWVQDHPDWARYLFQMRHAGFMGGEAESSITEANRTFSAGLGRFLSIQVEAGLLRTLPRELYIAILLGPCQELARLWLSGSEGVDLETAVEEIAEAAWQALRRS